MTTIHSFNMVQNITRKNLRQNLIFLNFVSNVSNFAGHKGRKYGSPVRIFTNMLPSKLPLPGEEGYWFCDLCEKWVSSENKHCFKCSSCTSKVLTLSLTVFAGLILSLSVPVYFYLLTQDGRTYVHCDKCARCVKPSWKHCNECKRCCLPDHKCGDFKPAGCFLCHKPGHKKTECPVRINSEVL